MRDGSLQSCQTSDRFHTDCSWFRSNSACCMYRHSTAPRHLISQSSCVRSALREPIGRLGRPSPLWARSPVTLPVPHHYWRQSGAAAASQQATHPSFFPDAGKAAARRPSHAGVPLSTVILGTGTRMAASLCSATVSKHQHSQPSAGCISQPASDGRCWSSRDWEHGRAWHHADSSRHEVVTDVSQRPAGLPAPASSGRGPVAAADPGPAVGGWPAARRGAAAAACYCSAGKLQHAGGQRTGSKQSYHRQRLLNLPVLSLGMLGCMPSCR